MNKDINIDIGNIPEEWTASNGLIIRSMHNAIEVSKHAKEFICAIYWFYCKTVSDKDNRRYFIIRDGDETVSNFDIVVNDNKVFSQHHKGKRNASIERDDVIKAFDEFIAYIKDILPIVLKSINLSDDELEYLNSLK